MNSIHIDFSNRQRDVYFRIDPISINKVVEQILLYVRVSAHFVSISFVSESFISKCHKKFFQDPSSTDCITFPLDSDLSSPLPVRYLGEVIICPKVALQSVRNNTNAFWKELTLYLVHGLLHLAGYEDSSPSARSTMKRMERKAMNLLIKKGLLLTGSFRSS